MTATPPSSRANGLPLGLTGATAATRYVGATASGAPASGTFAIGDFCIDQSGKIYVCTTAGSPGTWTQIGSSIGSQLDYAEITANVNVTAVSSATANTIITGNSVSYDGATTMVVQWQCADYQTPASAGAGMVIEVFEDGTSIGRISSVVGPSATRTEIGGLSQSKPRTPSSGSHTYSIRGWVTTGTGVVGAGTGAAGALQPSYMRIIRTA